MAAIAMVQLRTLDADTAYRRRLAELYDSLLAANQRVNLIPMPKRCVSARHLYQIRIEHRDEMILRLNENNIFPGVHYRDNREYRMYVQNVDTCPNATTASRTLLSLPLHLRMTEGDVKRVADVVLAYAGD
jgi:dTDP-4-amino-4,6-dideoxygalactose transaminase